MPTFSSIDFSRELASRLVAINDDNGHQPIDTPQALLSRHPQSLRFKKDDGTISNNPLHCQGFPEIRHEVAQKLVAHSLSGQRQEMRLAVLQNHNNETGQQDHHSSSSNNHHFTGCASVLDLLKFQKAVTQSSVIIGDGGDAEVSATCCVSTGSLSLDTLLGIPHSVASSISSSIHPQLCILLPLQGLPWGHVVQCSGPSATGKTQLALQIAASAAAQNLGVLYLSSSMGQGCLGPLVQRLRPLLVHTTTTMGNINITRGQIMALLDLVSFRVMEDAHQLLATLAQLEDTLLMKNNDNSNDNGDQLPNNNSIMAPSVVILDAASGCLSTEHEPLLQRVAMRLKQLARHYHLIVWINIASFTPRPSTKNRRNGNQQRHSIDGNTMEDELIGGAAAATTTANSPSKNKVTLGDIWKQHAWDIHVSLQITPRMTDIEVPPSSREPKQQQQEMMKVPVIRATLEAHPFKKCHSKHAPTSVAADFCITAKGIQDCSANADEHLTAVEFDS